jgi:hypothetical protein
MTVFWLQFTARKCDPETRLRYRWRHGPYRDRVVAEAHRRAMRRRFKRTVRVEVLPPERGWR